MQNKRTTNYFNYKREEGQNPYIGIMSFQHFKGEKLYSDIVVTPEARMTETERVECYPISADAEENGRFEGYYPDSSVVYIRILWKEFEPRRGEYNYKFIEDIFEKARAHSQTLIFRLMAHSTRACDDVPEWLKELIPCPARPDGERVKDSPTDPLFIELFLSAVRKFGERFDSDPILDCVDISLPGAWGEGHKLEEFGDNILERIVDVYTDVFKKTQLIAQAGRPELIRYAERIAPVGWRGDGLGHPYLTEQEYPKKVEKISDVWMRAPVSFESYWWLCEWKRQGWNIDKIIELTLKWHISSFNPKSMPIPYEWQDKIEYWISKMGYHLSPKSFEFQSCAKRGDKTDFTLTIENVGVAPAYRKMPAFIRLKNEDYEKEIPIELDVCKLMPGVNVENITIDIPADMPEGEYDIGLAFTCQFAPIVYLATDAVRDGKYYTLGHLTVE
jgi:hypothetical protein